MSVFKAILCDVKKDSNFDFSECSAMTEGYTPSDITALCSAAANIPVQERITSIRKANSKLKPPTISAIQTEKEKEEKDKKGGVTNVTPTAGVTSIVADDVASTIALRPLKVKVSG